MLLNLLFPSTYVTYTERIILDSFIGVLNRSRAGRLTNIGSIADMCNEIFPYPMYQDLL